MLLDERKLRAFLRHEAEGARVPSDMWQHISGQLDQEQSRPSRSRPWGWIAPGIGLSIAAAVFWLTLIPASGHGHQEIPEIERPKSRSIRVSISPSPPVGHQVFPVRYELGPETTLAMAGIEPPDYHLQRLGAVTR